MKGILEFIISFIIVLVLVFLVFKGKGEIKMKDFFLILWKGFGGRFGYDLSENILFEGLVGCSHLMKPLCGKLFVRKSLSLYVYVEVLFRGGMIDVSEWILSFGFSGSRRGLKGICKLLIFSYVIGKKRRITFSRRRV